MTNEELTLIEKERLKEVRKQYFLQMAEDLAEEAIREVQDDKPREVRED